MAKKKRARVNTKVESDAGLKKIIGARIKRARRHLGKPARWVAEQAGTTRIALTQVENGRNNVSATLLWKIASVLQCDIKEFFPDVPDSKTLNQSDLDTIAQENGQAAEFAKKAFGKSVAK